MFLEPMSNHVIHIWKFLGTTYKTKYKEDLKKTSLALQPITDKT